MIYHYLVLADLHWGVMEHSLQEKQYRFIFDTIIALKGKLDVLIIAGDFWESRMILNNKIALKAIDWMHDLVSLAYACGVRAIRVIKGTRGHDNDQLECFIDIEKQYAEKDTSKKYFRIINTCTYEETLPGMRALYCPEENFTQQEYFEKYQEILENDANIMFFHGSFNHIMPEIAVQFALQSGEFVYDYKVWDRLVDGPMFGGHWHNGETKGKTTYIGTPDKWDFASYANETNPGIGLVAFNTDDHSYYYQKIINPRYQIYRTFYIDTATVQTLEECQAFIDHVNCIREELKESGQLFHIRIQINITNDAIENKNWIRYLQECFGTTKHIKIEIKNRLQKQQKETLQESHQEKKKQFQFIYSESLSLAQKIYEYIRIKYGKELELDAIAELIQRYQT